MPLRGNCTICTDFFGIEQDISATFCGHLFHDECLSQWLRQCGTHRTCPQCRTKLTLKQVVKKLYVNVPETDDIDLDPYFLKNKVDEIESLAQKLKIDKKGLKDAVRKKDDENGKLTSKLSSFKKELKETKCTVEFLKDELKRAKELEGDSIKAQNEAKRLRERLRTCEKMEFILEGSKTQVDEMIQQYTSCHNVTMSQMRDVATFSTALKQEFDRVKMSLNKAKEELMRSKREVHKLNQELMKEKAHSEELDERMNSHQRIEDQLNDENKGLRRKLQALEKAVSSPSDTRASAISRLLAESPAPLMMTPVADFRTKQSKRLSSDSDMLSPDFFKKPKLSPSLQQEGVIDLDSDDANGSFIENSNRNASKTNSSRHNDNTTKTKNVCQEMGLKFVKMTSSIKSGPSIKQLNNSDEFQFRKPLGIKLSDNNVGLKRTGFGSRHFSTSRLNKVPMSSKAKPFTSKPVLTSALRPKLNLLKKSGPR